MLLLLFERVYDVLVLIFLAAYFIALGGLEERISVYTRRTSLLVIASVVLLVGCGSASGQEGEFDADGGDGRIVLPTDDESNILNA